jgi:hypothetical protein
VEENKPQSEEELLAEADRLAAEVEAELAGNIGNMSALPEGLELTPEMLENMDPAQLQKFLSQFGQPKKLAQSHYTRKQSTKSQRKKRRDIQKRSRAATRRTGWGRTISTAKRKRQAA